MNSATCSKIKYLCCECEICDSVKYNNLILQCKFNKTTIQCTLIISNSSVMFIK